MSISSSQAEALSLGIQLVCGQQWASMSTKHSHTNSSWFTSQSLFRNEKIKLMKSSEQKVFTHRLCPEYGDNLPRVRENSSELCWKPRQSDQRDWLTSLPLKQQSCDGNRKPDYCWLVITMKILQQDSKTSVQQYLAVNHKVFTEDINSLEIRQLMWME